MPSVPAAASVPVDKRPRIPVRTQFRQRHLGHGGCSRQRRAANGAKAGTGTGGSHGQTTTPVAHEGRSELEKRLGQPAMRGELAHQHEQRNDCQVVIRQAGIGQVVQREQQGRWVPAVHDQKTSRAADQHANTDMHAQGQQGHQAGKDQESDGHAAHADTPRVCCAETIKR